MVAIMQALALNSSFIILDEPTASLAARERIQLFGTGNDPGERGFGAHHREPRRRVLLVHRAGRRVCRLVRMGQRPPHRQTATAPVERLVAERRHLHVLAAQPHAIALGTERPVETDQTTRFGSVRYSTPDGHQGRNGGRRVFAARDELGRRFRGLSADAGGELRHPDHQGSVVPTGPAGRPHGHLSRIARRRTPRTRR